MTDKKPSDELTELEPLEPAELPELPEMAELEDLPELPELPEVDALPELPDAAEPARTPAPPQASKPQPPKPAPQPKPARAAEPAPQPKPTPKPVPAPPAKPAQPAQPVESAQPAQPDEPAKPAPLEPVQAKTIPSPPIPTPDPNPTPAPAKPVPAPESAKAGAATNAPPTPPAAPALAPGEKPPLRQLDKAPLHLKKAAVLVCVGSLAPWMGYEAGVLTYVVAKALVLAGAWFWLKQIDHNWGPKLSGFLGKLGELELVPKKKDDAKKPRKSAIGSDRPTVLTHSFPTGLHVLSLVLMIVGAVVIPFVDGLGGGTLGKAIAELGMLAWAAYTFVHIHSYERWGAFNPIFPMMFLAMLLGGFLMVAGGLAAEPPLKFAMMGGGLVVGIGGGLAAYTIVEAMMQAKKDGDAKKAAALEARRQARKSSK